MHPASYTLAFSCQLDGGAVRVFNSPFDAMLRNRVNLPFIKDWPFVFDGSC